MEPLMVDFPVTHDFIDSLDLQDVIRHYISERLLNRGMHALLDTASWQWMASVDINNINEGSDPTFDAFMNRMNSEQSFKYDVTWQTKPILVWLMRNLRHIAIYGISHFKSLYANWKTPMNVNGLWQLDTDPIQAYRP